MKKFRNILLFISIFAFVLINVNLTLSYLITEASPVFGTFIPNKSETTDLLLSVPINHNLGTNYQIPDNIYFEYEINLTEIYANKTISTTEGDFTADETGTIKVKIKANNDFAVIDIDDTIDITIKYLETTPGFTVENNVVTTKLSENPEVIFETIYQPKEVILSNFTVSGEKVLETREWIENETFTFKLETYGDEVWREVDTDTITYNSTNQESTRFNLSEELNKIKLPNVGEYQFRITEVINENQEITDFDNTTKTFTIVVTDTDMDGQLEISKINTNKYIELTTENDSYKLEVSFNNTFSSYELIYEDKPEDSILTEDIVVVKNDTYDIETVISKFDGLTEDYTYKLYDKNGNELNSTLVRTGDYVLINSNNQEYKFYMVLKGDVNGDGDIAPIDYVKIKNHIMAEKIIEEDIYKLAADYNDDSGITPLDYVKIKNHIMNGGK